MAPRAGVDGTRVVPDAIWGGGRRLVRVDGGGWGGGPSPVRGGVVGVRAGEVPGQAAASRAGRGGVAMDEAKAASRRGNGSPRNQRREATPR